MADEVASLQVRLEATAARFERDMQRASRALDRASGRMERRADSLDRRLNRVGQRFGVNIDVRAAAGAAALYGLGRALTSVVRNGDMLRRLEGRFEALTGSAERAQGKIADIFRIGAATGAPVEDVAETMTRFTIAAQDLGKTDAEVARLVESVLKLGALGGGTTQELAAGAQQLGQALASGRLQGDELRSILENMPLVARRLADSLGVSVGQLREMGKEGELTADKVFGALVQGADEIDARFAAMPDTVDRAANKLANSWAVFTAELDRSLGISEALASVLGTLGAGLERLAGGTDAEKLARAVGELREVQNALSVRATGRGIENRLAYSTESLQARETELLGQIRALREGLVPPPGAIELAPIEVTPSGSGRRSGGGGAGRAAQDTRAVQILAQMRERIDALRLEQAQLGQTEAAAVRLEAAYDRERITRELLDAARRNGATITEAEIADAQALAAQIEAVTVAIADQRAAQEAQARAQADAIARQEELNGFIADSVIGFGNAVAQTGNFTDALKRLALQLAEVALKGALLGQGPLSGIFGTLLGAAAGAIGGGFGAGVGVPIPGGLYAKGGAFQGGRVLPFAAGGVVDGPTPFPLRSGMGLMGEAGPEAILPLRRGAGGKLGVEAPGGGGQPVRIVNVMDPSVVGDYMATPAGERLIVNVIRRNRGALRDA